MDIYLSENAENLLCEVYRLYLKKLKSGINKVDAQKFPDSDKLRESLPTLWNTDDLKSAIEELKSEQLFSNYSRSHSLHQKGIDYVEKHLSEF